MGISASVSDGFTDPARPGGPVDPMKVKQGYEFVRKLPLGRELLPFSDFDKLYLAWDGDDGKKAKNAPAEQRRKLAYARYGFIKAPYENNGLPMGLVYDQGSKGVHFNCLLCHSGAIRGMTVPGLPNQRLDLATFAEDVIVLTQYIMKHKEPPPRPIHDIDRYSNTRGGSNVWIVEADLLHSREPDLTPIRPVPPNPDLGRYFDTTPSPYWNIKKKSYLYHAGFISVGPRPPMLAVLYDREKPGESVKALLPDFENVKNWFDSLSPPKYPGHIDRKMAARGKTVFNRVCSKCHGTYGKDWTFPNRHISKEEVGTDSVDLNGKGNFIKDYYKSWFNDFGAADSMETLHRQSYLAPPLDGIWASAPYLHNGSVPTLYHVIHPDRRPAVWKVRSYNRYDYRRIGLSVKQFDAVPASPMTSSDRRRYFDASAYGQGNAGHPFADKLTEKEKAAVLEYLKTL
jgi:mono/diheme cytochrome c family protein